MSAPPGFNASASMLPDPGASSAPIQVMRGGGQRGGFGAQEIETLKKYGLFADGLIANEVDEETKRRFLEQLPRCSLGSGNATILSGNCSAVATVLRKLLLKQIRKANGQKIPLAVLDSPLKRSQTRAQLDAKVTKLQDDILRATNLLATLQRQRKPDQQRIAELEEIIAKASKEVSRTLKLMETLDPINSDSLDELEGLPENTGAELNPFAPKAPKDVEPVDLPLPSLEEVYDESAGLELPSEGPVKGKAPNLFEPQPKGQRRTVPRPGAEIPRPPVEGMSLPGAGAHANPLSRANRVRRISGQPAPTDTRPSGLNAILARGRARRMGRPDASTLNIRDIEYETNTTNLGRIKPDEEEVQTVKYELDQAVAKGTKLEKNPSSFNCSNPSNTQNTFGYNTTKDMLFKNYTTNTGKLRVFGKSAKNIKTRGAYEKHRAKTQKARTNSLVQQQKANTNLQKSKQAFQLQAQKQTKSNVVKRLERELAEFKATAPPVEPSKKPGFLNRAKSWLKRGGKRNTRRNRK